MNNIIKQGSYANVLRLNVLTYVIVPIMWGGVLSLFLFSNEKMKQREIKEMSPGYTVRKW